MDKVKNQKSKTKNTSKNLKNVFYFFLTVFLVFFLLLNIFYSQKVSQLYFQLVNNKRQATVKFLKDIKNNSQFSFFLTTNINRFDRFLENEVFSEQKIGEEKIAELESLLKKNPKSRDINYKLYLLHKKLGNIQQTENYLKAAKEIDPNIK